MKKEEVLEMKSKFMYFHHQGYTIPEIAQMFGISKRTIYLNLQDIATAAGVARSDLLQRPHKTHKTHDHTISDGTSFVEMERMLDEANETINTLLDMIKELEAKK